MANSYKTLLPEDVATTRTLLHEAIPITGTIVSGTYEDQNIKYFAHGMYEAVYDYPFLSSSANHIFDLTVGYSADSTLSASTATQNSKKINIYNQMAQVLVGYDVSGNIQKFDPNGSSAAGGSKMDSCFFVNYARLLTKDEIKKDSFRLNMFLSCSATSGLNKAGRGAFSDVIGDYGAQTAYKTNSPAGEYGLLYTASAAGGAGAGEIVGHIYYQAGVAVLTSSVLSGACPTFTTASTVSNGINTGSVLQMIQSGTIDEAANHIRFIHKNVDFNNTTELNSTVYFCRANNTEFNYSSNPTYIESSEIVVKGNNPLADPISYVTTVGLYSADNELMAVAKLSEPLKKSPSNEITLRVRLDY